MNHKRKISLHIKTKWENTFLYEQIFEDLRGVPYNFNYWVSHKNSHNWSIDISVAGCVGISLILRHPLFSAILVRAVVLLPS